MQLKPSFWKVEECLDSYYLQQMLEKYSFLPMNEYNHGDNDKNKQIEMPENPVFLVTFIFCSFKNSGRRKCHFIIQSPRPG